jgi:hypothetical protein
MKAETKVERAAMVMPNFSEIPWLMRFPFVVICPGIEDAGESKNATSWRRVLLTKSTRSDFVVLMAAIETSI